MVTHGQYGQHTRCSEMGKEKLWDEEAGSEEDEIIDVEGEAVDDTSEDENLPSPDIENSIVRPVENVDEVVEVYDQFDKIKKKLLSSEDVTKIQNNNHINKSGWRKIATVFNLSVETVDISNSVEDGVVKYIVKARATAPNGKTVTGTGMCASNESNHMETLGDVRPDEAMDNENIIEVDGKWRRLKDPREVNEHNIVATAETRAKNRAISDLVGGGEVSAEEMKSLILE